MQRPRLPLHRQRPLIRAGAGSDAPGRQRETLARLLALIGAGILALAIFAHFAWVQPHLEQFQSGAGQLGRGIAVLLGNTALEQQYTVLVWESRACIMFGLIGGMLLVYGLLKRR